MHENWIHTFLYGCCYYPEHWDESAMEEDVRRIRALGFNAVRMGEFSWSMYEPQEGKYDFSYLRRAVDVCAKNGLFVILGTPTAAPPKWLCDKHPEILCADKTGRVMPFGSRQHHNHTSEVYLSYCRKIVTAMAEAFAGCDAVIGWQIDNELCCHRDESYAAADDVAFRRWLEDKYGTIRALNEAWGTRFWSQEYGSFSEVDCPRETVTHLSPGARMDYLLFLSDSVIAYAKLQYDILKQITPDKFVTHNIMVDDRNFDPYQLARETMDVPGFDSYPSFREQRAAGAGRTTGFSLSRVRGVGDKFLILEQQAGPGGQLSYLLPTPLPGQIRLWTYQSIAHGACGILYFRYKTAVFGSEQLWYGVYDHDGQENYRSREIRATAQELKRVGDIFLREKRRAQVAIYNDYQNQCGHKIESFVEDDTYYLYTTLTQKNIPCDILHRLEHAENYRVLILPHISIADEAFARRLKEISEAGTAVILSARSGIKDRRNQYYQLPYPGVFADLVGAQVEWFTAQTDYDAQTVLWNGKEYETKQYYEVLRLCGAQAIGTYTTGFCKGKPAFVQNGNVYYLGTYFDLATADVYAELIAGLLGPGDAYDENLEVFYYDRHRLILNYADLEVPLPISGFDLLSEQEVAALPPFGVVLLEDGPSS